MTTQDFKDLKNYLIYPEMNLPIYNKRSLLFEGLSQSDFINLFHRYYKGERTADLMAEYKIGGSAQKLTSRLPQFYGDRQCPYCNDMPMIQNGATRNGCGDVVLKAEAECENCGHTVNQYKKCRCHNCLDAEKRAIQDVINGSLNVAKSDYDYQCERGYVKLLLASVLRSGQDERDPLLIHPRLTMKEHLLAPDDMAFEIIEHLVKEGWLRLSGTTSPESVTIVDGKLTSINVFLATYNLNVEEGFNLIDEVLNPTIDNDAGILIVWNEVALRECKEYLHYQMKEYRLVGEIGVKTVSVLKEGLKTFSVSQMFNLIWGATKDAAALYQKGGMTKAHAVNTIPGSIQRKIDKAIAEGYEIKHFGRNYNLPQSIIADILYDRVLKIGERGFTEAPHQPKFQGDTNE